MMTVNIIFMNFTLKVKRKGQVIQKCQTHSIRRFLNSLRTINWSEGHLKVYLRVSYGRHEDNFGKVVPFYNDGEYETKETLWDAFNAFYEEKGPQ